MKHTLKIAFYGKGGIGKSTISSNLSMCFSNMGLKVLHIGCDPKSDSTLNIIGNRIETVTNIIREKGVELTKEDILKYTIENISCLEAGGPIAGMGCAGMGITTVFEELEDLDIFKMDWDIIIYDVLGDVICGGFAIPMKKQFVDTVYVVTSSEYMSLYAANNILKSVERFSTNSKLFCGGIIYNSRKENDNLEIVEIFSKQTNSKLIGKINHDEKIVLSELKGTTVLKEFPESTISKTFMEIATKIYENHELTIPKGLNDEEMEKLKKESLKIRIKNG